MLYPIALKFISLFLQLSEKIETSSSKRSAVVFCAPHDSKLVFFSKLSINSESFPSFISLSKEWSRHFWRSNTLISTFLQTKTYETF